MSTLALYVRSSIGRKWIVAVTGLLLSAFVFGHMAGNMLIFVSTDAYNLYGHAMVNNPLYKAGIIPWGLVATFLAHVIFTLMLVRENMGAREQAYAVSPKHKKARFASKWMAQTGSIVLVFFITHLMTFKYGTLYTTTIDGLEVRDLARLMIEVFSNPMYVAWYLVSLVLLGYHLSHGFSSMFKTVGLSNPRYLKAFDIAGYVYAVVVAGGFISQPIYVWFFKA